GCELQLSKARKEVELSSAVSVPVRGVSCNSTELCNGTGDAVSVPVRGVSCNYIFKRCSMLDYVSVPVRGCELQQLKMMNTNNIITVSVPVRGCELQRNC
ncbi:MAG: hypothetical protein J6I55_06720, partial [Ruminococcus sp.]|nr:hypothetical protein [Ruminococcus sp.]